METDPLSHQSNEDQITDSPHISVSSTNLLPSLHGASLMMNLSISSNFSVKLDETNYLIWREQLRHVVAVICRLLNFTSRSLCKIECLDYTSRQNCVCKRYSFLILIMMCGTKRVVHSKTRYIPQSHLVI